MANAGSPGAYVETMLKGIIGFDIAVTRLEGKYKLSQNRPAADRPGVSPRSKPRVIPHRTRSPG